jgi:hypothetical protein
MKEQRLVKIAAGTVLTQGMIALGGRLSTPPSKRLGRTALQKLHIGREGASGAESDS